jgi:NAD(P)-dependent dehydrogenase (short-subunit alcohol dehydrogenase family)
MAMNDSPSLAGKVALVTGGSRGLGREMVLAMARAGAYVVITSRNIDSCKAMAVDVEQTTGRRTFIRGGHVGHWDEIGELVDARVDGGPAIAH